MAALATKMDLTFLQVSKNSLGITGEMAATAIRIHHPSLKLFFLVI